MFKNKIVFIILFVIMGISVIIASFMLTGCNNNINNDSKKSESSFDKTQFEGYIQSSFTYDEGVMYIEYISKDHKDFVLLKCNMSENEFNEFYNIYCTKDNCEEQCLEFLSKLNGITTENLNDKIPDKENMTAYTGKTIADLESDGFEQTSAGNDDDGNVYFVFSNEKYSYKVSTVQKFKSVFDMENIDFNALEIEEVSFYDFVNIFFE